MADEKRWYVVEAFPGEDHTAYLKMASAGLEVWRPVEQLRNPARRAKSKKANEPRRDRRRPRFGRFIFLHAVLTDSLYYAVRDLPQVRGFMVYAGTRKPAPQPDELIAFYRDEAPKKRVVALPAGLVGGARVRVTQGPFAGFSGIVGDIDGKGPVRVELVMFGRSTPVILEVEYVSVEAPVQAKSPGSRAFASTAPVTIGAKCVA